MNTNKVLGLMMLTGIKGGSRGADSGKGKGNKNVDTGAQVDGGMQGSGTADGAAQEQPAAAAQPMTSAHVDAHAGQR
jgi:hypothetical protein